MQNGDEAAVRIQNLAICHKSQTLFKSNKMQNIFFNKNNILKNLVSKLCTTRRYKLRLAPVLKSLKQFFINVSYHIFVASLTLMALFENRAIRNRLATSI